MRRSPRNKGKSRSSERFFYVPFGGANQSVKIKGSDILKQKAVEPERETWYYGPEQGGRLPPANEKGAWHHAVCRIPQMHHLPKGQKIPGRPRGGLYRPIKGTLTTSRLVRLKLSSIISIARGFVGSLRIYPFFSRVSRCACTEEVDFKLTAVQISRTDGG